MSKPIRRIPRIAAGIAFAGLSLSALPALAADGVDAEAMAKCAKIEDKAARLVCYDAVASAMKASEEQQARKDAERAKKEKERREAEFAAREAELARREAELAKRQSEAKAEQEALAAQEEAARAAQLARREAELARREAVLARKQADAERLAAERAAALAAVEAEKQAAEARIRAAEERQRAEIERRDRELAEKDRTLAENRKMMANRLPQTLPILFGIGDLSPERAAKVTAHLDYESVFAREEELDRIELRVKKFGTTNSGKAYVVLEDGQMWRQKDSQNVRFTRAGPEFVEVKRGSMGSYFMRMDGRGAAIRARRIR